MFIWLLFSVCLVIGSYRHLSSLSVLRSEEDVLGFLDLSSGVSDLWVLLVATDASNTDFFVAEESLEDEAVFVNQCLNSGKVVLLAFEGVAMIEHLRGLYLHDLLVVDADMALIINRLVRVILLSKDLRLLVRRSFLDLKNVPHVFHESIVAWLIGS